VKHFVRIEGAAPVHGYSHAVACSGMLVYVSGQVPVDRDGRIVRIGDPEAQVRQAFHNLGVVALTWVLAGICRGFRPCLRVCGWPHNGRRTHSGTASAVGSHDDV